MGMGIAIGHASTAIPSSKKSSRLDRIIDLTHALVKLSRAIDWRFLEAQFGSVYSDGPGCPPLTAPSVLALGLTAWHRREHHRLRLHRRIDDNAR